jgi:hypothetical protein
LQAKFHELQMQFFMTMMGQNSLSSDSKKT